jgi:hypothetical protein
VTVVPPVACTLGANCTQGLVVALSVGDNDTTLADVTTTIGSRVDADPDSFGFAGLEAVRNPAYLVSGPSIRTRTTSDGSVRLGLYMLSRGLVINYGDYDGDQGTAAPVWGPTGTNVTTNGNSTAASNTVRIDAEGRLWNWMTADRFNFDPLASSKGFITCSTNPGDDVCSLPGNICCAANTLFPGLPAACVPGSGNGGPAFWPVNDGVPGTSLGGANQTGICCSNLRSVTAAACPEVGPWPADYACGKNSDCISNNCADIFGIGINVCQ